MTSILRHTWAALVFALAMYVATQFTYSFGEPTVAYNGGATQIESGTTVVGETVAESEIRVEVGDRTVRAGGITSVPVMLTSAPGGLSGYLFEISVDDSNVARITDVDFPEFGLVAEAQSDGSRIRIAAADLFKLVEDGAANANLATISVEGLGLGASGLRISVLGMDDDAGMPLTPEAVAGAITVY